MSESSQPSQPSGDSSAEAISTSVEAAPTSVEASTDASTSSQPQPSYVKLAMRNMVRKRGISLYHFALTTIGLLALLIGLAYLTR